ncbi:unnamed protein product [Rotaria socialis]|uniref:WASH complex subunit FAM21 n=1 Tax=Rotaria socialis TaxID=392032 RepID=A0A820G948_9BILA|nr:unnamed protein product [Rotaria socialis]
MDVQLPPPPPPPPPAFFVETTTPQITIPPPPPPPFPPSESVITTTTTAPPPPTTAATPPTQERIWLHPWTATEMRQQASQWTLAGDAGLLLSLEQFSDKLVQRADAIQQHLNQTVNAVKSTHTRVQNCLNEFTSLANTQFIENRVYDEDETINAKASKKDEQSTEKTVSNSEAQEKVLQRYVEAIQYGLAILDTHFEHVEAKLDNIQNGASSLADDDEDVGVPVEPILEPKDPYIFRPLPYLIGTTEFMQDDFVGLGDLLNTHDEETYDVEQIEKVETDSALSSSDQEDDDFQVQVSQAPIVPAGASRPDLANRQIPPVTTTSALTDSEDDDDPFGMNTGPKFDDLVSKKPLFNDNLLKESNMPITHNTQNFNEESDNEESSLFGIPPQKLPSNIEKNNESSTLEELDETEEPKQQMGGMPLLTGGQKVQKSTIPVSSPPVKKPVSLSDENSDEEIFGITNSKPTVPIIQVKQAAAPPTKIVDKKDDADLFNKSKTSPKLPPTTQLQKVVPLSETDDEDDLFNTSTSKPKVLIKDTPQVISPLKSNDNDALFSTPAAKPKAISKQEDDDDDLFPSKSSQIKLPAANVSSPLRSKTVETSKIDTYQDPLSVNKKPTEPTTQPATTKGVTTPAAAQLERKSSSDSDEEESSRKRQLNPAKLKDGEKVDVRKLLKTININPNALKPGTRPKARSITEEAPKSSVVDDGNSTPSTEPAPAPAPAPTAVKNLPKLDSESDDEDLFTSKKKVVPPVSVAEQKKKTDIETEKVNVKDISSRIKINPMMHMPGAQTKQVANEEHESSVNTQTTSTETLKEESTVDKTMLNMYKDRAKVSVKNRAPPTRKTRSSGAAAASSANETDDLFGLSSSNEAAPSSSPTTIPVISPPTVSVTPPPPAPVTGLLDTTVAAGTANAAISDKKTNVKQKKAFSLFDSDDSDTDELLFGSKNKSSAVSKPLPTTTTATSSTTPKTTIKPSVLALDDDDSDFLSKRPIKKGTKRMDNDDIFADVKTKTQQTNKAKKDWSIMNKAAIDDTDDIFNEVSTKSSASSKSKPVNVKNKTIKDLDDIFDDPLNISTK